MEMRWLAWAKELQSIAQIGLTYAKDPFDIERYERLRQIAADILSAHTDLSIDQVKDLFCNEVGYQTPKIDTRAAIFKDDTILLVQERSKKWSLPGGWVDIDQSIGENTVKEVKEETGLDVEAIRLIALHERNRHNPPPYPYSVCKIFVLCSALGGSFIPNTETLGFDYFSQDDLPTLALEKNTPEQVALCFKANDDPLWQTQFD